jgi:cyclohexanone monooxygenase
VHTDGKGIERITERGIVANGVEYELDCIIFASGFEVGTPLERRAGYEVYGRGGVALSQKWKDGVSTMFGMQTHGFPNCFIVGLSQTGVSANIPTSSTCRAVTSATSQNARTIIGARSTSPKLPRPSGFRKSSTR